MNKLDGICNRPELQTRLEWLNSANQDGYANYDLVMDIIDAFQPYYILAELVMEMQEKKIINIDCTNGYAHYSLYRKIIDNIKELEK